MYKQIFDLLKELRTYFFLNEWEADYVFTDLETNVAAKIYIDQVYLRFRIEMQDDFFKRLYKDGNYEQITSTLVHEFCHTLTEPLYLIGVNGVTNKEVENLEDIRERQTQRICNIIMRNLPKKYFLTNKGHDKKSKLDKKPSKKNIKTGNRRNKPKPKKS